ncbi:MAG TPA: hypothetical protein VH370_15605 [Humisphaera sp.]|jgi:hypothetical protein|nr:hypothetical protein [Humisphaera sp.]
MKKMIATLLVLLPATAGLSFGQTRGGRTPTRLPRPSNETASTQTPRASEMAEPYRDALTNISIFARDHRGSGRDVTPTITPPRTVNPETYLVFRGVAKEGAKFIGFIEDTRDSSTFKVNVGDSLGAQGTRVARLDVAEMVLRRASGGQSQPIELGCNLLGREIAPPEPAIQPSTFSRQGSMSDLTGLTRQVNNPRRGTRGTQDPTQTQNRNQNGRGGGRGRRGGGGGGNLGG